MKGAINRILLCLFIVAILSSGQVARGQPNTVRACTTSTPPILDGTLDPGEWTSRCTFDLQLAGVDPDPDDPNVDPPPDLPMTLIIMKDSENVYLGFGWNHDTQNPDQFLLGMGFDFDADGVWEDNDNGGLGTESVHTVDDAMLLVYLGFSIGNPNPPEGAWVKIYIPDGVYVLSWGDKNDDDSFSFDAIAGPPIEYGTIYHGVQGPVLDGSGHTVDLCPLDECDGVTCGTCVEGQDYGAGYTPVSVGYAYVLEFKVPRAFFHSPAGFGFALTHEDEGWTWPAVLDASQIDLSQPGTAEVLGKLVGDVASGWGRALLDPGFDEEGGPVGGVMTTVDKVTLVMPWIAACAMLGLAVLVVSARKRRT